MFFLNLIILSGIETGGEGRGGRGHPNDLSFSLLNSMVGLRTRRRGGGKEDRTLGLRISILFIYQYLFKSLLKLPKATKKRASSGKKGDKGVKLLPQFL